MQGHQSKCEVIRANLANLRRFVHQETMETFNVHVEYSGTDSSEQMW